MSRRLSYCKLNWKNAIFKFILAPLSCCFFFLNCCFSFCISLDICIHYIGFALFCLPRRSDPRIGYAYTKRLSWISLLLFLPRFRSSSEFQKLWTPQNPLKRRRKEEISTQGYTTRGFNIREKTWNKTKSEIFTKKREEEEEEDPEVVLLVRSVGGRIFAKADGICASSIFCLVVVSFYLFIYRC